MFTPYLKSKTISPGSLPQGVLWKQIRRVRFRYLPGSNKKYGIGFFAEAADTPRTSYYLTPAELCNTGFPIVFIKLLNQETRFDLIVGPTQFNPYLIAFFNTNLPAN
jgi:hypothetical protein